MTKERIKEILGLGKYLKVRYRVKSIGSVDTDELCTPNFDDDTHLILHTDNWANDYYKIPYADIIDVKPKGAKSWQR